MFKMLLIKIKPFAFALCILMLFQTQTSIATDAMVAKSRPLQITLSMESTDKRIGHLYHLSLCQDKQCIQGEKHLSAPVLSWIKEVEEHGFLKFVGGKQDLLQYFLNIRTLLENFERT